MRVSSTTIIRATPEQVWEFITVPENGPRWQGGAVWTKVTTPGPVRIGTQMEHMGRWLRVRILTVAVVTVFDRPITYGYDISTKFLSTPSSMRYELAGIPGGTHLTLSNDAPLTGLMKLFAPLLRRSVQAMFNRDVVRLKHVVEAETVRAHGA